MTTYKTALKDMNNRMNLANLTAERAEKIDRGQPASHMTEKITQGQKNASEER